MSRRPVCRSPHTNRSGAAELESDSVHPGPGSPFWSRSPTTLELSIPDDVSLGSSCDRQGTEAPAEETRARGFQWETSLHWRTRQFLPQRPLKIHLEFWCRTLWNCSSDRSKSQVSSSSWRYR